MLTRREVLALMGGLPFTRPDQHYEPPAAGLTPGSRSGIFRKLVIIAGAGGGLFVYSPTPGAGNLIASLTATSGTDTYGNNYLARFTAYSSNAAIQITAGVGAALVNTYTGSLAAGWTAQGSVNGSAANLNLTAGSGGLVQVSGSPLAVIAALTGTNVVLDVTNTASATAPIMRGTINALGDLLYGGRVSGDTNSRLVFDVTAAGNPRVRFGPGNAAPDAAIVRTAANLLACNTASFDVNTVGQGYQVAEGTNAKQGTATLAAGTVTVANTSVTANSRIFLTAQNSGAAPGALRVSARTAGTSFTITSTSNTDTSLVAYEIFEPG